MNNNPTTTMVHFDNATSPPPTYNRRRRQQRQKQQQQLLQNDHLWKASFIALSLFMLSSSPSGTTAFQSTLINNHKPTLPQKPIRRPTMAQFVVTDPELLQFQLSAGSDDNGEPSTSSLKALEDAYMLSSVPSTADIYFHEGLDGEMIETQSLPPILTEQGILASFEGKVQFRGLTTIPNKRSKSRRAQTKKGKLIPIPIISGDATNNSNTTNTSSMIPTQQQQEQQQKESGKEKPTKSKSSTMPGLSVKSSIERKFQDGIKIAEQRGGRNLSRIVNTPEAKAERRRANGQRLYKATTSVPDSLVDFANQIHLQKRITPQEEIQLGQQTQDAIELQDLYDNLKFTLERDPTDEEWCAAAGKINMEAIRQTIEEGTAAKNKLVSSNLRMVQSVVNVYIRNGLGSEYNAGDLMQEGILALIRAAEKFDPNRGFRFSTYAMYWIRAAVKRAQIFQSSIINIPPRLHENHKRILRVRSEMAKKLDRTPTNAEVGAQIGMSELQVNRCLEALEYRCCSLDEELRNGHKPMSDPSRGTLHDLIASKSEDNGSPERKFLREDLIKALRNHLTDEAVAVLLLRYGLVETEATMNKNPERRVTYAEVGRVVGLKPDKVRRLINKSLEQLRTVLNDEEWFAYESAAL